jgi:hypothetical protein
MLRDEAVERVAEGLGFRPDLTHLIVKRLQEAQTSLEQGKSLPRFLLAEDQPIFTSTGVRNTALPVDFLREFDYEPLRYVDRTVGGKLTRAVLVDAFDAYGPPPANGVGVPQKYVLRNATVDWYPVPDGMYELTWSYYARAATLDANIENEWLASGADWLIGEAGYRLAMSLRDAEAVALFSAMRTEGRQAVLFDDVAREFSGRPYVLGAAN